jgi:hypothetical protein
MKGNDSLGLSTVIVTWNEGTHSENREFEVTSNHVAVYVSLLEEIGCTNIHVNNMEIDDYLDMKRGNPK